MASVGPIGPKAAAISDAERRAFESRLETLLRSQFGGHTWITASGVLQASLGVGRRVLDLGATDAFALATRVGVGSIEEGISHHVISGADAEPQSMLQQMREVERLLHDPPPATLAVVDEWDPDRRARTIVDFTIEAGDVAGRPTFGAREPHWVTLEDKIAILPVFDAAGVPTAPHTVVALDDDRACFDAAAELAAEQGTVWAFDNAQGWHGAGAGTAWVQSEHAAADLIAARRGDHRLVRIQPFLEGVPCSVHGMVIGDDVIAFRPCEMVVLRDASEAQLVYARTATFWDPPPARRDEMRRAAVAVGDELRHRIGMRGIFTLDGVMTADGFRPTEVNTRMGAALPSAVPTLDGDTLSVFLLNLLAVENLLDVEPARFERWLLQVLDENRQARSIVLTPHSPSGDEAILHLRRAAGGMAPTEADDPNRWVTVRWGPNGAVGGVLAMDWSDQPPVGPSLAPWVVEAVSHSNNTWQLGLPTLSPAIDLHAPESTGT